MIIIVSVFCAVTVATLCVQFISYRQYLNSSSSLCPIKFLAKEEVCPC